MLFVYIVAAVLAGLVSYGSVVLFGLGLSAELSATNADYGLAMFMLVVVGTASLVAVGFLLKAAYDELVYWDFHTDIRDWCYYLVLNRLPKDAVAWDLKGWYEYNSSWYGHEDLFHPWYK